MIKNIDDIKGYYINLDNRTDRNDNVINEIQKSSYLKNIQRYSGINGKNIDIPALDESFITKKGKEIVIANKIRRWGIDLTYGSVGCALSHFYLYKKCLDNFYESILIFEDDITLTNNIDTILEEVYNLDFTSFDILYLGCHNKPHCIQLNNSIFKVHSFIYGCFGYLVTNRGARNLLQNLFPITKQFDSEISTLINKHQIDVLITQPHAVNSVPKFGTDNQGVYGLKKDNEKPEIMSDLLLDDVFRT